MMQLAVARQLHHLHPLRCRTPVVPSGGVEAGAHELEIRNGLVRVVLGEIGAQHEVLALQLDPVCRIAGAQVAGAGRGKKSSHQQQSHGAGGYRRRRASAKRFVHK